MAAAKEIPMFRLLICDDHPHLRAGLRLTANQALPGCQVTEVGTLAALLAVARGPQPFELLILDVRLPDGSGLQALEELRSLRPELCIWVTSGADDPALMGQALNAGANGYLPKSVSEEVLAQALRDASQGRIVLPALYRPGAAAWNAQAARSDAQEVLARLGLTPRQRDVLACILRGQSAKQIARTLDISGGTVKSHTAAIFGALGVNSRANVIVKCSALGIPLGTV
jgi:DNA-binding NarL/FixJ family response regulator